MGKCEKEKFNLRIKETFWFLILKLNWAKFCPWLVSCYFNFLIFMLQIFMPAEKLNNQTLELVVVWMCYSSSYSASCYLTVVFSSHLGKFFNHSSFDYHLCCSFSVPLWSGQAGKMIIRNRWLCPAFPLPFFFSSVKYL